MMIQAFYTGLSGVKTHSSGIDVIADDLANINTVGYRGSGYEFSSMYEEMIHTDNGGLHPSSTDNSIGIGTRLHATPMMQSAGAEMLTDKSTDLAIRGDGWFGVAKDAEVNYTRNGNFSFDADANLVTKDGAFILGTMGDNIQNDVLTKTLKEIPLGGVAQQKKLNFPKFLTYPPEPSTKVDFFGNIGVDNNQTMGASVIDKSGDKNDLKLEFTKQATQTPPGSQWNVKATLQSHDGTTLYDTKTGAIAFNEKGGLLSSTLPTLDNNGTPLDINLGKDFNGIVSIANTKLSSSTLADGTVRGNLRGYDISKNGEVIATFTNGKQSSVGKVALYHFRNNQGLERVSGDRFLASSNSGKPHFFQDKEGKNILGAEIENFTLEGSNVSTEYGLTELIILQRSYDANAKSITTADQMMQKALSMDA